jgi:hypothetical protein
LFWKQGGYEKCDKLEAMEYTIPSDSRFRPDVILLKLGQNDFAEQEKTNLEEIGREDAKLREQFSKQHQATK